MNKYLVPFIFRYQNEGNFENAFILYIKFTTLFLEKILQHPEYKAFDPLIKRQNKEKLKEVFPLAEKLKQKLFERFERDYEAYLIAEEQRQLEQLERERILAAQRQKEKVSFLFPFASNTE